MKKLSKRFLTLAIACVMAMAMAVPTFAAAPKRAAYAGVTYTILSKSNGLYASAQDGTNVQLASYAQKWTPSMMAVPLNCSAEPAMHLSV